MQAGGYHVRKNNGLGVHNPKESRNGEVVNVVNYIVFLANENIQNVCDFTSGNWASGREANVCTELANAILTLGKLNREELLVEMANDNPSDEKT